MFQHSSLFSSCILTFCLSPSQQIIGALLLYGCGSITGAALKGFKISFLIAGAVTIIIGLVFVAIIPVSPSTAWFLTVEEREVAVNRVAQEHASAEHSKFEWYQFWQTIKDPKLYLIFLWAFLICATSIVSFGSM